MIPYTALSAYYFAYFGFVGAFSPYFSLYFQSVGLAATQIGLLMSVMQFMRIVAPGFWGWLSDRLQKRVALVRLCALLAFAAYGLFFLTPRFESLFAAIALVALFWSASLPLVESLTFDHLGARKASYGRIRLWGSVGFIVAVLGIGYALDHLAIPHLLWMTALFLGGLALSAFFLPEAPKTACPHAPTRFRDVLCHPGVAGFLGSCFFMSAAHGALYVFYSIQLSEQGYDPSSIGWMWTLGVLAEIGVFLAMPWLQRHVGLSRLLMASFGCAVVRFLLIGWQADVFLILIFAQLLHGMTFGAHHAAAISAIHHWFAGPLQARGQALYGSLSFGAGGMLGAAISGFFWTQFGAAWTFTLSSGFALIGGLLIWKATRSGMGLGAHT
jgi:MFS transporter, PPP family, 3-phenylpropionic acid transporter